MVQDLNRLKESASQTAGPYVHIGCTPNMSGIEGVFPSDLGSSMINSETIGRRITLTGRIFDGTGTPLRDALVEIWQADSTGLYPSPSEKRGNADANFSGFGRCATDLETGFYSFDTIKPGVVPAKDGRPMAPHISVWVVARGINLGLHTRAYFSDETDANAADPVLARVEHKVRIPTLIAQMVGDVYTFDIHLQGSNETIFFDI